MTHNSVLLAVIVIVIVNATLKKKNLKDNNAAKPINIYNIDSIININQLIHKRVFKEREKHNKRG